jgi:hypothetical protein
VDGGMSYLRRVGEPDNYEDMSYYMDDKIISECVDAVKWGQETGRNELGIVLAVIRALKKRDAVVVQNDYL